MEEWCIGLKVYNSHQVEEAQRAAVNELIRYHTEKAELFQKYKMETAALSGGGESRWRTWKVMTS